MAVFIETRILEFCYSSSKSYIVLILCYLNLWNLTRQSLGSRRSSENRRLELETNTKNPICSELVILPTSTGGSSHMCSLRLKQRFLANRIPWEVKMIIFETFIFRTTWPRAPDKWTLQVFPPLKNCSSLHGFQKRTRLHRRYPSMVSTSLLPVPFL